MRKDSLGDRMKDYESISKNHLIRRLPVIIRLDGKSFHTLTANMKKPFDDDFIKIMQKTTEYLVKNIEGCSFGYTQSDEISLLLTDYKTIKTEAWFDYNVQKLVSVSSSLATGIFNKLYKETYNVDRLSNFDSRCFNLPKEEVENYFIWRQKDFFRNSIQMVGRSLFSQKELKNKSCDDIQEMLFTQKGINYNNIEVHKKRGTCVIIKNENDKKEYFIDMNIPIFTQNREYITKYVYLNDDLEMLNNGLKTIEPLLAKDWNSSEDDIWNNEKE